ncbi:MAG: MotA/TolQ/ExbB proton channel family protein [Nitrosomonas sp.]|nr:MotA/TolQ/ExbB proton channel family protein [Nitrosomonas sp.]
MKKIIIVGLVLAAIANLGHAKENESKAGATAEDSSTSSSSSELQDNSKPALVKQSSSNLETAYKREYAFLEAQKRELTERLRTYQTTANREEQALNNKIGGLERNSVSRSIKIDQLTAQLNEVERKEAAATERNDILGTTLLQAEATLKNHGIEIPSAVKEATESDPAKIKWIFEQALSLLHAVSGFQTTSGKFFLTNGKQAEGTLFRVGNIAAYGISPEGSGSLAPAGGGEFKVWKHAGAESAVALSSNEQPNTLQLFLFESRTAAVDELHEQTLLEHIDSGGPIGWVIVTLGLIGGCFILIRMALLRTNSADTKKLSDQIIHDLAEGNLDVAKQTCQAKEASAIGRVLLYTLRHLKDDRDHMEGIVYEAILQESGPLDRFGPAILVIASVAPLLGLLGTVTGMIETFDSITQFGTGDPRLLSEGIAIALVTTELGLVVAIPTLLLGSLLTTWARNIKRDMEHAALRIVNIFMGSPLDSNDAMSVSDAAGLLPSH